ncbi:MAG TPA: molybdate ABC transporter substrate-binding protein [Chitinophagaceae bacterium]|nr:molybdate ABC transporter substrate-binding protein [Chitinophagaceae bacterium]
MNYKNNSLKKISLICCTVLLAMRPVIAQTKITVAVAANMQYAIKVLIADYQKTHPIKIDVVLGASGNLTQQITQGAPYDIFVSADTSFPQKLSEQGFTTESPKVYARGALVLWTTRPDITPSQNLQSLLSANIKSIAIANPATAPYGSAAQFILKKYNLYGKIASKLVTGESITQTSQFIATGAADIGFTAKSIVLSDAMKGKGRWIELNIHDYPPIRQAAVLLKYAGKNNYKEAKGFYDFLFSAEAREIYKKFGYNLPSD